jgi:hypothetical protein
MESTITGVSYPLSLVNGGLRIERDRAELVQQAIISALSTYKDERVMRPKYGIITRVFDALAIGIITADLRNAVTLALADYADVAFTLQPYLVAQGLSVTCVYQIGPRSYSLSAYYDP